LLRGGKTLTVTGELLNVIEEPQIQFTVVRTFTEDEKIQRDSRQYESVCISNTHQWIYLEGFREYEER
jgi:hypothetical protein